MARKNSDNRIKELRKANKLSARQLSEKTSLDLYTIYRLEWGYLQLGNSSLITIVKLCKVFKCKAHELFKTSDMREYLEKQE